MIFERFELERWQSQWENVVRFNLAESGVHPMGVDELVDQSDRLDQLLNLNLGYSQTNGTEALRAQIARMYAGADASNVLVTTGGAEANFLAITSLMDREDHAIVMMPNYMQVWGLLRGSVSDVQPWWLREARHWAPDPDELQSLINYRTRLIAICNPNNPTGAVLSRETMQRLCEVADRAGAWILTDEVYQGAEREGELTPSFWGLYDKVIVTNGLSKAYGLPGLRVGWMVAPKERVEAAWSHKDYTTISPASLSDFLARIALSEEKRPQIHERTRTILNANFLFLKTWLDARPEFFEYVEPRAGAMAWVKGRGPIRPTELVMRVLHEKSLLLVPGEHFHMPEYLRIGFGLPGPELRVALTQLSEFFSVHF